MQNIMLPAIKSLTVTSKIPNGNINEGEIFVGGEDGYKYVSYLLFDISTIPSNASIISAEVVLFKTNNFSDTPPSQGIYIYPLMEYFSSYTTFNESPGVTTLTSSILNPATAKVAVSADLTFIVSLWHLNKLQVPGIALIPRDDNILWSFGSAISNDTYLIPFLKVVFNSIETSSCNIHCPAVSGNVAVTKEVRLIGTVAAASKYASVIDVEVERVGTGIKDSYYVTDEFDNSLSGNPLPVDKTYNIAIVPGLKPGDTETVEHYGSYRGLN
ncbi:DNRLRE domain-containing protein [Alloiococcus sp. CFN-8]|uniref:DNRLRE domain-containing protein n=1 Tax=Alloiococcus sp. CFN-8 TaxID=3416081 RepID=UPI003CEDDF95